MSREARVLAKASTAALILAGVVAAPAAQAAVPSGSEFRLEYTCKYPVIDKKPLSITFTSKVGGSFQSEYEFNAVATAKGLGGFAPSIEGTFDITADLGLPDGFVQEGLLIPLTMDQWVAASAPAGDAVWTASGTTPSIQLGPLEGDANFYLDRLSLNLVAKNVAGSVINIRKLTTDFDGNDVPVDTTPNDFDVYCKLNEGQSNLFAKFKLGDDDNSPPTKVTGLTSPSRTATSVDLSWNAATDPDPGQVIEEYRVYQGSNPTPVKTVTGTSARIEGLTADTTYQFKVAALYAGLPPLEGSASDVLSVTTRKANSAPTIPTNVKAGPAAATSVGLSWTASTDDVKVLGYNIYRDGVKVGTSTTPTFNVTGLVPGTRYSFQIEAFDDEGLLSPKSAAVDVTVGLEGPVCPDGFACQAYSLAGSTQIKTLSKGVLPLKGGIDAQLDVSNGKFTADLTLNPTSGRLISLAFLPVTVKISFAPSGKTTGTLDDANILRSKSLVRIKVSEVKLFGAIPLAGGNSCQTKSLSEINLTSTKAFEIFKGGTLTGSYAISDLNGCGPLNGLVSPLTAGKGNTISLDLTPKA